VGGPGAGGLVEPLADLLGRGPGSGFGPAGAGQASDGLDGSCDEARHWGRGCIVWGDRGCIHGRTTKLNFWITLHLSTIFCRHEEQLHIRQTLQS
jgi:hypothetical protein